MQAEVANLYHPKAQRHILAKNWATHDEWKILEASGDSTLMVWAWIHSILNDCVDDGIVGEMTAGMSYRVYVQHCL